MERSCISLKSEEQNKNSPYISDKLFSRKVRTEREHDFYIGDKSRFYSRQLSFWKSLGQLFIFITAIDKRAWSAALKFFSLMKREKLCQRNIRKPNTKHSSVQLGLRSQLKLCVRKKIFQISKTLFPRAFSQAFTTRKILVNSILI